MDQDNAVAAVKTLIEINRAILLSGLEQNELEREIEHLSDTWLSTPFGYYAIKIRIPDARERPMAGVQNSLRSTVPRVSEYDVIVAVGDEVLFDATDEYYGSLAHRNFRKLCDRLVELFQRQDLGWIPSQAASPRYRLPPESQAVAISNLEPMPLETGFLVGSEISFMMYGCND